MLFGKKNVSTATIRPLYGDDLSGHSRHSAGPSWMPWLLEAASLLASVACIFILLVILNKYDNKPVPDWKIITLNGLISVLSDLGHAAMIYPVSEAIGQLKWLWYWNEDKPRPIRDFGVYDNATRGPFGSLVMLSRLRMWHLSTLGALLTVVALAMQFSIQLMPTYKPQLVVTNGTASIGRSVNFTDYKLDYAQGGSGGAVLPNEATVAMITGLFGTTEAQTRLTSALCSTGNCTWNSHQSLGACSACKDISDEIKRAPSQFGGTRWTYGPFTISHDFSFSAFGALLKPIAWKRLQGYSISTTVFVYWNATDRHKKNLAPRGFDCSLYWCVHTFNTSMTNGKLKEDILDTWPTAVTSVEELKAGWSRNETGRKTRNDTGIIRLPESNVKYTVTSGTASALQSWMDANVAPPGGGIAWGSEGYGDYDSRVYELVHAHNGPSVLMEKLARSLTTYMRNKPGEVTLGQAYEARQMVHVRWEWAILPLVLLGLTLSFLLATAVISVKKRLPIWKNSALPSLIYRMDDDVSEALASGGPSLRGLEDAACGYQAAIASDLKSWKLKAALKAEQPHSG